LNPVAPKFSCIWKWEVRLDHEKAYKDLQTSFPITAILTANFSELSCHKDDTIMQVIPHYENKMYFDWEKLRES